MSPEGVRNYLKISLQKLQLSYVDLFLLHSPVGLMKDPDTEGKFTKNDRHKFLVVDNSTDLIAVWKEMEKMVDEGHTKSIGVCNFCIKQLKKIEAISKIPCVNLQVELNARFQQKDIVKYCKENGIVITAYSPLGSPGRKSNLHLEPLISNPVVKLVADNHKVTTAQVLIRFLIQEGFVAIPKSVKKDRIRTNGEVFDFSLTATEMDALRLLDKGKDGRTFFFLKVPGMSEHPEYPEL